jgi:hypothetical protein
MQYGYWAADQQDAYNKTDWTYCYNPDTYDSKCSARGIAAPPPRLSFDLQPMPPSLTTLVPQDTTSAPAPPQPQPWMDLTLCESSFDGAKWSTKCPPSTAVPFYTGPGNDNSIDAAQLVYPEHASDELTQPRTTTMLSAMATKAAAQAQTNVAPTASAPPAPTSPPVPPGALPSTGIIVGAAVGLAALLLLV